MWDLNNISNENFDGVTDVKYSIVSTLCTVEGEDTPRGVQNSNYDSKEYVL